MVVILLHSSKTMRKYEDTPDANVGSPRYLEEAKILNSLLRTFSLEQITHFMKVSPELARSAQKAIFEWRSDGTGMPAMDAFLGDIYSGLQVETFTQQDRRYAHEHLFILSGLYGVLKALDAVLPYRLEMGYRLPATSGAAPSSLYDFWDSKLADAIPVDSLVFNLSSQEYTKTTIPILLARNQTIITPHFLTVSEKTGEPTFVTVHAKIARGAYSGWLIKQRVQSLGDLPAFSELGYRYDESLSSPEAPVYVARKFKGLGLSVRQKK